MRTRIQRNKTAWTDLRFELKTQRTKTYRKWVTKVLSVPDVVDTLAETCIREALDISMSMSVTRSHVDLELLIYCWGAETHTFVTSKREFPPRWRTYGLCSRLSQYANNDMTSIILSKEEEEGHCSC